MQATLAHFSPDHIAEPTEKPPKYDCQNCDLFRGFVPGPKVSCLGRHKEIPKNGCASWSDGQELVTMQQFAPPAGFRAKNWAGGRA